MWFASNGDSGYFIQAKICGSHMSSVNGYRYYVFQHLLVEDISVHTFSPQYTTHQILCITTYVARRYQCTYIQSLVHTHTFLTYQLTQLTLHIFHISMYHGSSVRQYMSNFRCALFLTQHRLTMLHICMDFYTLLKHMLTP